MKRKPKVQKPVQPISIQQKIRDAAREQLKAAEEHSKLISKFTGITDVKDNDHHAEYTIDELLKKSRKALKDSAIILQESNRAIANFKENLKKQEQERLDKEEEIRVRKITHPNLPEQIYRPYTYWELRKICDDYAEIHPFKIAFLSIGMKSLQSDIDFYYGGDITKAIFYPIKLNWLSYTLLINGKQLNDRQREINNLSMMNDTTDISKILIPELNNGWINRLKRFTQTHSN